MQRARSYALTNYLRHVLLNRVFLYAVATTITIVVYRSVGLPRVVWLLLKVAIFIFSVILGFYICSIAFILACVDNIRLVCRRAGGAGGSSAQALGNRNIITRRTTNSSCVRRRAKPFSNDCYVVCVSIDTDIRFTDYSLSSHLSLGSKA